MTCGVCLKEQSEIISIFSPEGMKLQISTIVKQHFWFEPIEDDMILSQICYPCWEQIANFHVFYTSVKSAHNKLSECYYSNSQYVDDKKPYNQNESIANNFYNNDCTYDPEYPEENDITAKVKFTEEDDEVDKESKIPNEQLYYEKELDEKNDLHDGNEAQIINESEEEEEFLLERINYDPDESNSYVSKSVNKQNKKLASSSKNKTSAKKRTRTKYKNNTVDANSSGLRRSSRNKKFQPKKSVNDIKQEDELIAKYVKLSCEICLVKFSRFTELNEHYVSAHKIKGYVRCCNKKLHNRTITLDHINQHINPEIYRCKGCHKTFSSLYAIRNHLALKHAREEEKVYTCDDCPEKFTNQHALNHHISNNHITEEQKRVYCIDCRRTFPTVLALQMHKNVYHGKIHGHVCHVCGKTVDGKTLLTKHLNEHVKKIGKAAVNDPVCPICGKLSASVKTLRHHIRYVHSSQRPHKCTVCGKAYKIRQKLREHMGSHAEADLFPCPYCTKRFRSKLYLYSHKYRVHRKEYENEKEVRFNLMIESCSSMSNFENAVTNAKEPECYEDSIVLSEDSSLQDDDCYVVS